MQIVADLDTPTLQWTRVATPASLPFPVDDMISINVRIRIRDTY